MGEAKGVHGKCFMDTVKLAQCCHSSVNASMPQDAEQCKTHIASKNADKKAAFMAHGCFVECYFNSKGLIDQAGEIDKSKSLGLINEMLKDHPDEQIVATAAFDKCYARSKLNELPQLNNNFMSLSSVQKMNEKLMDGPGKGEGKGKGKGRGGKGGKGKDNQDKQEPQGVEMERMEMQKCNMKPLVLMMCVSAEAVRVRNENLI